MLAQYSFAEYCSIPPPCDIQLVQGLGKPEQAVECWKRAIASLPVENLTPAEQKQRDQYRQELTIAEQRVADFAPIPKQSNKAARLPADRDWPWNRAKALLPQLVSSEVWLSSVSSQSQGQVAGLLIYTIRLISLRMPTPYVYHSNPSFKFVLTEGRWY